METQQLIKIFGKIDIMGVMYMIFMFAGIKAHIPKSTIKKGGNKYSNDK